MNQTQQYTLKGIKQTYVKINHQDEKIEFLKDMLKTLSNQQILVYVNSKENAEKIKAWKAEYRAKNTEAISKQVKEYREKNKEHIIEKQKEYVEKNKELIKEKQNKWYQENKEKILEKSKELYT